MGMKTVFVAAVALLALAGNAQALDLVIARATTDGLAVSRLAANGAPLAAVLQDDASDIAPIGVAFSADGTRVYVGNESPSPNEIRVYNRDPTTGTLTFAGAANLSAGQYQIYRFALTPDGRFLYAATFGGGSTGGISGYAIGVDGSLTSVAGATFTVGPPGGRSVSDLVVTPDGGTLLAARAYGSGELYQFAIDSGSGALIARNPASIAGSIEAVGVSPDGRYAYAAGVAVVTRHLTADGLGATVDMFAQVGTATSIVPSPDGSALAVGSWADGSAAVRTINVAANGSMSSRAVGSSLVDRSIGQQSLQWAPDSSAVYVGTIAGWFPYVSTFAALANGADSLPALPLAWTPATSGDYRGLAISPAPAPVAVLATPSAATGRTVAFDASASTSDSTTITRYDWDFGDSTTLANGGAQPTHTYAAAGSYTARVTVTNGFGCSTSAGIWTGTQYSCVGGASATTTRSVTVSDASTAPAGSTPAAATSTPTLRTTTPTTTVRANAVDVVTTVTATGPGVITVRGTLPGGRATKAACTSKRKVTKSGSYGMTCTLGKAARAMLRTRPLRVTLLTAFTPTGGSAVTTSRVVVVPRRK
jgi:PKD repeat protein/6-phosphogluconolactonase (cycloisomerase 2 family)